MKITISIKKFNDEYRAIAKSNSGATETIFPEITFLSEIAAGTWVSMHFLNKFSCRRVAGKWILEV